METSSFSIKTSLPVLEDLKLLDSQHRLPAQESVMVSAYSRAYNTFASLYMYIYKMHVRTYMYINIACSKMVY